MIANKKVLAVIPARGGSKGIPNKNIVPLLGKPLISWTIEAAQASRYIDRLILSSDDPQICAVAESAGCEVPFTRRKALATDEAKTIDVIFDALDQMPGFDLVMVLQPTSPLRAVSDIDNSLELLIEKGVHSAVSVTRVKDHPYLVYAMNSDARMEAVISVDPSTSLRRQDLPPAFTLNGAIYIADISWLAESRSFISPETVGYEMPKPRSVDIDEEIDLKVAEQVLRSSGASE